MHRVGLYLDGEPAETGPAAVAVRKNGISVTKMRSKYTAVEMVGQIILTILN
jgi:hypothetical protein